MISVVPLHLLSVWVIQSFINSSSIGVAISYNITYCVAFMSILMYTKVFTKNEEVKKCLEGFEYQNEFFVETPLTNLIWSLNDYSSVFSLVFLSGAAGVKDQSASLISYCVFQCLYMWPLSCSQANFSMI